MSQQRSTLFLHQVEPTNRQPVLLPCNHGVRLTTTCVLIITKQPHRCMSLLGPYSFSGLYVLIRSLFLAWCFSKHRQGFMLPGRFPTYDAASTQLTPGAGELRRADWWSCDAVVGSRFQTRSVFSEETIQLQAGNPGGIGTRERGFRFASCGHWHRFPNDVVDINTNNKPSGFTT